MNEKKVINFMGQRKVAAVISILLIVVSIGSLAVNKLSFGLDFTGGTAIELHYEQTADLAAIRAQVEAGGFPPAVVATFGTDKDVSIRVQTTDAKLGDKLVKYLRENSDSEVSLKRVSYVGPQIGEELRDDGGLGLLFALAVVMVYVAVRFQLKFSLGAVAALAHDVLIVLGIFSVLRLDFDLTVLAAILAVIGYSLNDTIVVSDRIRENFRKIRKASPTEVINISLSQTLGRTLITSLTTLLVLLALFFVGGETIHNFAIALITGVVVGTYSSIYVAANILLMMDISKEDLLEVVVEKEGADQEEIML
ncbi:protein translocase subunit SecF [Agarilytica rhodophyticola]|uniref:protein translocase subunit SecF n=1 Tax=Agarilytica rhodophyticola TaxID=1737490 RepID=UPI000B3418F8|nr:protein translocase subunit SecF [Agarilytica rhodophyticola]